MDIQTLLNLEKNPHYKLSADQRRMLEEYRKPPMTEFGKAPVHNNTIPKHSVKIKKVARKNKYEKK